MKLYTSSDVETGARVRLSVAVENATVKPALSRIRFEILL